MKKHFRKILIAVACVVILVWIGLILKNHNKNQAALGMFTSPDGTFSTQLPNAWDAQLADQSKWSIIVTFVTDSIQTTSNNKPYIHIAKWAVQGDLDTVYADTVEKYKKLFKNFQSVQETNILIGGSAGKRIIFDGMLGGKILRYAVAMISHNGAIYTVTASAAQMDFDKVNPVLEGIIKDWKFLQ